MAKPKILTEIENIENKVDKNSIINDLTIGGIDKVASAETVKMLNNNKADKSIIIGGSNNIRLIAEIQNYVTYNGFNLEVMLHNMYLRNGNQLSNAFLIVGKYNNTFDIDGTMHILTDKVNITNANRTTIQITDTGKIYSVNNIYSESTSWSVIKKTNNVVIYDNPTIVTSIEGNVIWDSELNKTNLATTDKVATIKANEYINVPSNTDFNTLITPGVYTWLDTIGFTNIPATMPRYGKMIVSEHVNNGTSCLQEIIGYIPSSQKAFKTYRSKLNNSSYSWSAWEVVATTGSTEFNLSLGQDNGVNIVLVATVSAPKYRKEDGFVAVYGEVKKEDNSAFTTGMAITIGTLPAGFFSNSNRIISGQVANNGQPLNPVINPSGAIIITIPSGTNCTTLRFNGVFYVGGGTV